MRLLLLLDHTMTAKAASKATGNMHYELQVYMILSVLGTFKPRWWRAP